MAPEIYYQLMHLKIDPKIFEQHPDLKVGVIIIRGLNNNKRVSAVESLLRGVCAQRARQFAGKDVYEEDMIRVWCNAYGKFGVNPKKYPPSIAALLKRVATGKELPHINVLVDLYNYFSLKYLLPIGGEDLDWLCGDLKLAFTDGGEPFRSIGSIEVEYAKEGEAAYKDDGGITCRYWNYRECERSKFTNKTVNAVILVEDLSKMHMDEFGKILNDIQNNMIKYIGGQIEPYILNEDNAYVDLGVEGRKSFDDAKVPQQEKAYFIEQKKKAEMASVEEVVVEPLVEPIVEPIAEPVTESLVEAIVPEETTILEVGITPEVVTEPEVEPEPQLETDEAKKKTSEQLSIFDAIGK